MELELLLTNERRALPSVQAMTHAALQQLDLDSATCEKLSSLVMQTAADAVDHAYPPGESGNIRVVIREKRGKLEIQIRDFGIPQDITAMEQRLHEPHPSVSDHVVTAEECDLDEVHWIGYGREGKAFQIVKWLHAQSITDQLNTEQLASFQENVPLAPEQTYSIRRMRSEEALQVSQLMYRAYGNTYFNEDVYYPERVAAQNEHNSILSFVAAAEDGTIAGHYALELNQPGPVAEGGQAVVDPAHRSRGLLNRMKDASLQAAKELNLVGWYADAVAVHTFTQQSNVTHGGHLTAIDLAIAPKTESFRSLSTVQPQRVTCLLYFHWLKEPVPRTVSVPARQREIVTEIYRNLGCEVQFLPPKPLSGHGTLAVNVDPGGAKGFVRADVLGEDTAVAIRHIKRELVERSHMEAVYVELPLTHPGTAEVAEAIEDYGFAFIGIAPHFSDKGDILRLAYLVEPLAREPIKTYEEFAGKLVDYVLAEQVRVRGNLPSTGS